MKRIILLINILTISFSLSAQEKVNYKFNDTNIEFTISQEEIYVEFSNEQKAKIQQKALNEINEISNNSALIQFKSLTRTFNEREQQLKNKFSTDFQRIEPVLIYKDGTKEIAKGELNIKLKVGFSLNNILKDYEFSFQHDEFVDNQYIVKLDLGTVELFQLVNKLQIDDRIEFAEPNFIRMLKPQTNDPFFNSQWAINNQGYLGGTVDADMDVDDAWAYATGSGIKVAIIDEGVDLTHDDLTPNLLSGYDATGNGSNGAPNENNDDAHGTACAGIVAAVANNTEGVAGVAYNAEILPIRIAYSNGYPLGHSSRGWISQDSWIASGINWAVQNGADILSNSWGGGSPSTTITNAITNAVNNGRSGKGCLVLFAAGNYNTNVHYPATLPNVVAVGASSMCDERKRSTSNASLLVNSPVQPDSEGTSCDGEWWWGSNYGSAIDVVAPGVKIYTTDISGSAGYSSGDYKSDFNGTSSACPNAAGVSALVLSMYPYLTQTELRNIIEKSTDKIGSYSYQWNLSQHKNGTWNNEVGYGRLNAYNAVQYATQYVNSITHEIVGPTQLTPGLQATYNIVAPYGNTTNYVWSIPSGCHYNYCWNIINGQGTSQLSISAGDTGIDDITCHIYDGGTLIGSHYITVNVQNPYSGGGGGTDPCGNLNMSPNVIYPPVPCDDYGNMNANSSNQLYFNHVNIYNMYGQLVFQSTDRKEVNISNLSNGVYIVHAEISNGEILSTKIIKN